jgi:hypothetical protein
VGCTITRNAGLHDDLRAPDDPARDGVKEVLLALLGLQTERRVLLLCMLLTGPYVDHAQAMATRSHPNGSGPHLRVDRLGVEGDEAHRLREDQEGIRLGLTGLCEEGCTAEEVECPDPEAEEKAPPVLLHEGHAVPL